MSNCWYTLLQGIWPFKNDDNNFDYDTENIEEQESVLKSSDDEGTNEEFDEPWYMNVDCTSKNVHFLDKTGESDKQLTRETFTSNASKDMAAEDKNKINIRFQP